MYIWHTAEWTLQGVYMIHGRVTTLCMIHGGYISFNNLTPKEKINLEYLNWGTEEVEKISGHCLFNGTFFVIECFEGVGTNLKGIVKIMFAIVILAVEYSKSSD